MNIEMRNILLLYVLVIQVLFVITGCAKNSDKDQFDAVAHVELASIRNELELYHRFATHNEDLRLMLAQSILRHVLMVRTTNPKVKSMRDGSLETMCLLTEPATIKILNEAGVPGLAGLAHEYLKNMELEVKREIEKYQKTLRGSGCYIAPNKSQLKGAQADQQHQNNLMMNSPPLNKRMLEAFKKSNEVNANESD